MRRAIGPSEESTLLNHPRKLSSMPGPNPPSLAAAAPCSRRTPELMSKRRNRLHHSSGRSCRVDRLGQATEFCFGLRQSLHDRQNVAERTGVPVQFPHYEHITFA